MDIINIKNHKTKKNGFLEIRDNGYFLIENTHSIQKRKSKFLGSKIRSVYRFFKKNNWYVVPPKKENMDIAKR